MPPVGCTLWHKKDLPTVEVVFIDRPAWVEIVLVDPETNNPHPG